MRIRKVLASLALAMALVLVPVSGVLAVDNADVTVTADSARIMRIPGTKNYKGNTEGKKCKVIKTINKMGNKAV